MVRPAAIMARLASSASSTGVSTDWCKAAACAKKRARASARTAGSGSGAGWLACCNAATTSRLGRSSPA